MVRLHSLVSVGLLALALIGCSGEESPTVCTAGAKACASDAECGGFRCLNACCTTERSCLSDAECPAGEFCSGGVCVEPGNGLCASSSDCTDPTPHCETGSRACVSCLNDLHCDRNGAKVCNAQHVCEDRPGGCTSDVACRGNPDNKVHCDTDARTCVECTIEDHCIGNNVCVLNRCVPPNGACATSAACSGATPVCDTSTSTCVECLEDECGAGERCENRRCVTAGCTTNAQCAQSPASPKCNVATGVCVACVANADCGDPTLRCEDNACVPAPGCTGDGACQAPSPFCETASGVCVECRTDAHCGSGKRCSGNACVPVAPTGCTSDASCLGTPLTPRCNTTSGACVACLEGDDCTSSGRCNAATGTCLAGCASDDFCDAPTPKCDPSSSACVACLADGDCGGGGKVCRNKACVAGCTTNGDCTTNPAGRYCQTQTSTCVACLADGDCGAGKRCDQNQCVDVVSGGVDEPCGAGGSCTDPEAVCVGSGDEAFCRTLCDPYAANECDAGRVCDWIGYDDQLFPEPIGVCVPKNEQGAAGAACQSSADCEKDLLCLPSGINQRVCSKLCDPDVPGAGCGTGQSCHVLPAFFDTDLEEILVVGACAPTTSTLGEPCDSDYSAVGGSTVPDCGPSLTCAPGPLVADSSIIVSYCQHPAGAFTAGQGEASTSCTGGASCRSGDCLGGPRQCNTSCQWTSDCTRAGLSSSYRCLPYLWFGESAYTGDVNVSTTGACLPTCKSDQSCGPDRYCHLSPTFENSGQYVSSFYSYCYFPLGDPAGPKKGAGKPCSEDGECASGTCVTNGRASAADGYCFGSCDSSSSATGQCDPLNGVVCDPAGVGLQLNAGRDGLDGTSDDAYGRAFVCAGSRCDSDWDCLGYSEDPLRPRSCQLTLQVNGANSAFEATTELRTTCEPSVGSLEGGESCTNDAQCLSGDCFLFSSGDRACFGACEDDFDCAGWATCELVDFGGQDLWACVP